MTNCDNLAVSCNFSTQNSKTTQPELKSRIDGSVRSDIVYELWYHGLNASFLRKNIRQLVTRLGRTFSGINPSCLTSKNALAAALCQRQNFIIVSADPYNLITLDTLHIARKRPKVNTERNYRQRKLTQLLMLSKACAFTNIRCFYFHNLAKAADLFKFFVFF